uniref:Uncharacterized protein n=1 Tax=Oryza meridionalis TaxID=40149 RepID=A0A0E0F522_9ORYZ
MAPGGFEIASSTTFPAATQISFGAFDFIADNAGKLRQVSPGVTGPVMACRYAPGTKFSFGSLDFIATSLGILKLTPREPVSPTTTPTILLGISIFVASAAQALQAGGIGSSISSTASTSRSRGHHGSSKCRRPRLPRELGSRWVNFLDQAAHPSDLGSGSSSNTPTSSHPPREIFVVFQETDEENKEHEEEECRIQQQQEDLTRCLNELRQRGRLAQDAILEVKLGDHAVEQHDHRQGPLRQHAGPSRPDREDHHRPSEGHGGSRRRSTR